MNKNWCVVESGYDVNNHYKNETIFAVSNGFIGSRATFEEGYDGDMDKTIEGNFINGFYESEVIKYGEKGYGFPDVSQTMLNVPNAKGFEIYINHERCNIFTGNITDYKRVLDLKRGLVTRSYIWSKNALSVYVEIEKFASMTHKNKLALRLKVKPITPCEVKVISFIESKVQNDTPRTNARIDYGPYEPVLLEVKRNRLEMIHRTKHTGFDLITHLHHSLEGEYFEEDDRIGEIFYGHEITLDKVISYHASTDEDLSKLNRKDFSYDELKQAHLSYYQDFWNHADVSIEGDDDLQIGMRFNMFHLLQATGRDGKTSVGAKGLTGEGYEGHAFWDTEMYALPFFLYTKPEIAKSLLEFRYHTLDQARDRAKVMAVDGALYPWRTINGEEASPYFPAGTAQYHINADIAFAVWRYFEVTGDMDFMKIMGTEILVETARFWFSYGDYIDTKDGKFCINGVTGPDEYTAIVNNNFYTNSLAKENLINACKSLDLLAEEERTLLQNKLDISESEPSKWLHAADNMYIGYNKEKGLYPQDDAFFDKAKWDIENTPKEKFPLLDNYHPLMIYNKQVSKQADIVLAIFLLEEKFDLETIKKHYDYYEAVTVHESSLSFCIHSILASHIGYHDQAYDYFMKSARLDLDDVHNNTHAGIHMANLAGTWMCIVNGFGGMKIKQGNLHLDPVLPEKWDAYAFTMSFKGTTFKVTVKDQVSFEYLEGPGLDVHLYGKKVRIEC
ncbi:glycoside hydrolase family 65 protein [Acidaminobacter sp. JC074]|uniref:glycoside hydrolase family 65 protein n=1 Tax=Acidaminobacter sp. JC074 TaxID=2530199 RepID=UPI001F0DF46C|nr:glycosyl hydrolase family 65 protein [Acidaminobacter sp. JC074]MCH4885972.1 glycoside hydrolase family 65 protein [Acidaminobacter sp. JC074]